MEQFKTHNATQETYAIPKQKQLARGKEKPRANFNYKISISHFKLINTFRPCLGLLALQGFGFLLLCQLLEIL